LDEHTRYAGFRSGEFGSKAIPYANGDLALIYHWVVTTLPVLDLPHPRVAQELRRACEHDGFFYLANYGVRPELSAKVRREVETFVALPVDAKLALHFEKASKQRGDIPLRAERTDPIDDKTKLSFKQRAAFRERWAN